jgi:hypothetical protein
MYPGEWRMGDLVIALQIVQMLSTYQKGAKS